MKPFTLNKFETNKKKLIIYVLITLYLLILTTNYKADSIIVLILFIFIIIHCTNRLLSTSFIDYGLTQIFYMFNLFFLGIAPLFQYLEHITIWGGDPFTNIDYIETNCLIITSLLLYQLVYNKTFRKKYTYSNIYTPNLIPISNKNKNLIILFIITLISSVYTILRFNGNISSLLFRVDGEGDGVNNPFGLINSFIIRPLPAICLMFYIIKRIYTFKRKNISPIEFLWLILILLILSPIGVPRFVVAAFYIPIALMYLSCLRKKYNLMLFLSFALVFIFPILDIVRRDASGYALVNSLDMFLQGHFDSYQMFMRTVSTQYITYGEQLLGVIFFFIPRSIWGTKPVGSGYLIAHENNYYFDNVSMCYLGEGYINFGYLGVWGFATLIAYFNARMDRTYWLGGGKYRPTFSIIFLVSLGMEFIIMRGALLNVLPAYIAFVLSVYLIGKISSIKVIKCT